MHFTIREIFKRLTMPSRLAILATVTVICGLSGPYDSLAVFGPVGNFLFWFVSVAFAMALAIAIDVQVDLHLTKLRWYIRVPLKSLTFSMVYGGYLRLIADPFYSAVNGQVTAYGVMFMHALLISFPILLAYHFLRGHAVEPGGDDLDAVPVFFRRLPPKLGRSLVRISSQDHYVEVVTERGRELVLMRFSDAVRELSGTGGCQVHRSHWVSRHAVVDVRRGKGKLRLVLKDGSEVPVSRTYRPEAEKLGLLSDL